MADNAHFSDVWERIHEGGRPYGRHLSSMSTLITRRQDVELGPRGLHAQTQPRGSVPCMGRRELHLAEQVLNRPLPILATLM